MRIGTRQFLKLKQSQYGDMRVCPFCETIPGSRYPIKGLTFPGYSWNSPRFVEPDGLVPRSQEHATRQYQEPD